MAREWGNGDPVFNKMFINMFGTDDAETRRRIFKHVCVPFRLGLYLSLFYFCRYTPVIIIILIMTAISIILLAPSIQNPGNQWWSRRWHLATASAIFITAFVGLLLKYKKNINEKILLLYIVPSLFIIDLMPALNRMILY
jgi:hypothetical protein